MSESDNCSSVATAQIPVPQQRSSIRRNEYVNIPIPPRVSISSAIKNSYRLKQQVNLKLQPYSNTAYNYKTVYPIPSIFQMLLYVEAPWPQCSVAFLLSKDSSGMFCPCSPMFPILANNVPYIGQQWSLYPPAMLPTLAAMVETWAALACWAPCLHMLRPILLTLHYVVNSTYTHWHIYLYSV